MDAKCQVQYFTPFDDVYLIEMLNVTTVNEHNIMDDRDLIMSIEGR